MAPPMSPTRPYRTATRRRRSPGDLLLGLVAVAALVALTAGVPYALVTVFGLPIPHSVPRLSALSRPLDVYGILRALSVLVWLAWIQLVCCVIAEVRAAVRNAGMPARVPLAGGTQALVHRLVTAALLLFAAATALSPAFTARAPAAPAPRAAASAAHRPPAHGPAACRPGPATRFGGTAARGAGLGKGIESHRAASRQVAGGWVARQGVAGEAGAGQGGAGHGITRHGVAGSRAAWARVARHTQDLRGAAAGRPVPREPVGDRTEVPRRRPAVPGDLRAELGPRPAGRVQAHHRQPDPPGLGAAVARGRARARDRDGRPGAWPSRPSTPGPGTPAAGTTGPGTTAGAGCRREMAVSEPAAVRPGPAASRPATRPGHRGRAPRGQAPRGQAHRRPGRSHPGDRGHRSRGGRQSRAGGLCRRAAGRRAQLPAGTGRRRAARLRPARRARPAAP